MAEAHLRDTNLCWLKVVDYDDMAGTNTTDIDQNGDS